MQLSNLALAYLIEEMRGILTGVIVRKIQEIKQGELKLKLQTKNGLKDFIVSGNFFFVSSHVLPVNQKPSNFCLRLKKFLLNKKILQIFQHKFERIVFIELENFFLVLELFHAGNVLLLDKNQEIIEALNYRDFSHRSLKRKQKYVFPPQKGIDPADLVFKDLFEKISGSGKDAFHALVETVNIAPEIAEEIFFTTGIKKNALAKNLQMQECEQIFKEIKKHYSVSLGKFFPMKTKNDVFAYSLNWLAGKTEKDDMEKIQSINGFLDDYYSQELEKEIFVQKNFDKDIQKKKLLTQKMQMQNAFKRLTQMQEDSTISTQKVYASFEEVQAILDLVNAMERQKKTKQEILDALKETLGIEWFEKISWLDLIKKEIVLEL